MQNEIELLKNLEHPNILKVIEHMETKESLFFVFEFIENGSLADVVKKFGVFPENLVAKYMHQALKGLEYLHKNQVRK